MAFDINLNFKPHPLTKDLVTINGRSGAIKQSLKNIIMTNYYDRGFNVEMGTNVTASLFENLDNLTSIQLKQNIENAVANFEPRVTLVDVEVYESESNELTVNIVYQELNSPDIQNLLIDLTRFR
jgi:phage baseplate assembly protein W